MRSVGPDHVLSSIRELFSRPMEDVALTTPTTNEDIRSNQQPHSFEKFLPLNTASVGPKMFRLLVGLADSSCPCS
jgi:hypothetical protein